MKIKYLLCIFFSITVSHFTHTTIFEIINLSKKSEIANIVLFFEDANGGFENLCPLYGDADMCAGLKYKERVQLDSGDTERSAPSFDIKTGKLTKINLEYFNGEYLENEQKNSHDNPWENENLVFTRTIGAKWTLREIQARKMYKIWKIKNLKELNIFTDPLQKKNFLQKVQIRIYDNGKCKIKYCNNMPLQGEFYGTTGS